MAALTRLGCFIVSSSCAAVAAELCTQTSKSSKPDAKRVCLRRRAFRLDRLPLSCDLNQTREQSDDQVFWLVRLDGGRDQRHGKSGGTSAAGAGSSQQYRLLSLEKTKWRLGLRR